MMLQFAIVSQSAAVDRFTNRLSLFNVIEAIQSPRYPVILTECAVVIMLRRSDNEPNIFDSTITLNIAGNRIAQSTIRVNFENRQYVRLISNFQNLPILAPGELQFIITIPNAEPITTSIPIVQFPPPAAVPGVAVAG
jgi:hypothetical protein